MYPPGSELAIDRFLSKLAPYIARSYTDRWWGMFKDLTQSWHMNENNTMQYMYQIGHGKMCVWTDSQAKSAFLFANVDAIYYFLQTFAHQTSFETTCHYITIWDV